MIWKEFMGAVLRWLTTIVLGWFVTQQIISQEQASRWTPKVVSAALGLLATLGLSLWQKYRARLFGAIAKEMPAGVSTQTIKREMKSLPVKHAVRKAFTQ